MNKYLLRTVGAFYLLEALFVYFAEKNDWFSAFLILAALSLIVFRRELAEWARTKYPGYWMLGNSFYDRIEQRSDRVDEKVNSWLNNKPPQNPQ